MSLPIPEPAHIFRPILDELLRQPIDQEQTWQEWRICPVLGGGNGLLYHLTGPAGEFAVKLTLHNARRRAGREYRALRLVELAGSDLAPRAVLLDESGCAQDIVVQTWVTGETLAQPPRQDGEWLDLIRCFAAIHQISPYRVRFSLDRAVINFHSATQARGAIRDQARRVPAKHHPPVLKRLLQKLDSETLPAWPRPRLALCRVDANFRNFIRRPSQNGQIGKLASVDWENSGWGDPIFELADLRWHPAYESVSPARWEWVMERYLETCSDPLARLRLETYIRLLAIWWVIRFARYLYEIPRGLDPRLAARPPHAEIDLQAKLEAYCASTEALWLHKEKNLYI